MNENMRNSIDSSIYSILSEKVIKSHLQVIRFSQTLTSFTFASSLKLFNVWSKHLRIGKYLLISFFLAECVQPCHWKEKAWFLSVLKTGFKKQPDLVYECAEWHKLDWDYCFIVVVDDDVSDTALLPFMLFSWLWWCTNKAWSFGVAVFICLKYCKDMGRTLRSRKVISSMFFILNHSAMLK